jgi:hypothetical protein
VVVGRCRATIADVFRWFLFLHFVVVAHVVHGILGLPPFLLSWVFYFHHSIYHSLFFVTPTCLCCLLRLTGSLCHAINDLVFWLPTVPIVVPSLFCCVLFSVASWLQFREIHVMYWCVGIATR